MWSVIIIIAYILLERKILLLCLPITSYIPIYQPMFNSTLNPWMVKKLDKSTCCQYWPVIKINYNVYSVIICISVLPKKSRPSALKTTTMQTKMLNAFWKWFFLLGQIVEGKKFSKLNIKCTHKIRLKISFYIYIIGYSTFFLVRIGRHCNLAYFIHI